jgi:hypothetical protein
VTKLAARNDPDKLEIAAQLRRETALSVKNIADRRRTVHPGDGGPAVGLQLLDVRRARGLLFRRLNPTHAAQ